MNDHAHKLSPSENTDSDASRGATAADNRYRILIVDDDAAILDIMGKILTNAGHSVKIADDGENGWAAFCAEAFDVLITDHHMPRLSGVELLRRLRQANHQVPVILISGNMPWSEADLPQLLSPGTMIQKPFSSFELFAAVRSASTATAREHSHDHEQSRMDFGRP